MSEDAPVLELRGITKRFPASSPTTTSTSTSVTPRSTPCWGERRREDDADERPLRPVSARRGEILINGQPVTFHSPKDAISHGIGMVHQHFMLIPVMTVAENVILANEPTTNAVFLDHGAAEERVRELAHSFGFAIDPEARIQDISVGQQQRVEILKALYRRADVLILDEPTAVLTPQEAGELFEILGTLIREGMSVIFISHKLNEVLEIAHRISVLRRGKLVETVPREGATEQGLRASWWGGKSSSASRSRLEPRRAAPTGRGPAGGGRPRPRERPRHLLRGSCGRDRRDRGRGRQRPVRARRGPLRVADGGRRLGALAGRDITGAGAREIVDLGMGHVPEDRQRRGLVLDFTLAENLALHDYDEEPNSRFGWLFPARIIRRARELLQRFDVRGGGPETRASALSGATSRRSCWPVRSAAIRTSSWLPSPHGAGRRGDRVRPPAARRGARPGQGVLLVSLELEEILSLSDRILVMYEGAIVAEYGTDVTEEELGIAMIGGTVKGEAAA